MEVLSTSTQETANLARGVAKKIKPGSVIALYGDLGSGKTTFTKFLVEALGEMARVQSPTFVLMRKYGNINHVDLYRLTSREEAADLGLEELLKSESITVIEWPELIEDILPVNTIMIKFEAIAENERKINVQNLY